MARNLLVLGGTSEASALADALAERGVHAIFSYAGRVAQPRRQPIPQRVGGFGGVPGLTRYLRDHAVSHVIDATHPFAAQMSWNAYHACKVVGVPLVALTRPPWRPGPGDDWRPVRDVAGAVEALSGPARRVLLALGRLHMDAFAAQPQHHYILRLVDTPKVPPALPDHTVVVARGPFDVAGDIALFRAHGVEMMVCKNAGGAGAVAKLHAARALEVPVIMIDRPELPPRPELARVEEVLDWLKDGAAGLHHPSTDRGV
ncbi:precorrin-6A reductase [Salinihabitans flavidus]|uniref:Precorrin-6A reductase n=1 Tax=Salinihabitans flavidus TaxID=569882 RepID=A0A1H8Q5J9_9RHOB|nr:cobalt-precorrin-6A reductase [Salinihabitans flavidus]SEO49505.1 precorrin-6A reductase [Salinihabitans flavidus]